MIKPVATSLLIALSLASAAVAIVGANLGGAFAVILVAMLIAPVAGSAWSKRRVAWISIAATSIGASLATVGLLAHDAFALSQVSSIALTAFAAGLAAGSLVRLLMVVRIAPVLASAIAITLSLAWLAWPIWLSPWLSSDVIATRLAAVHPLLAVNSIAPQFGYWIQMKQMYRLTTLGQDVLFSLPTGVTGCVLLHLVIAMLGALPLLRRPRVATATTV